MEEKLNQLEDYEITLIRWHDNYKHWRLGLNWKSEGDFEFICEKPTVEECIDMAIEHIRNKK